MRYAAAFAAVGCLMTVDLEAGVIEVPGTAPSIQEAVEMASSGDEIMVAAGTYLGPVDFLGKAIVLRSAEGASRTIIDALGEGSAVTCANGEGPLTVLGGFTIRGGNSASGGGMKNMASSPTVIDCIFRSNIADQGGGMYNDNASPTVINCLFTGNVATDLDSRGGGMHNSIGSNPTVINCTFAANIAAVGGGIANVLFSSPTVTNCIIWSNEGASAISSDASSAEPTVRYCDVEGGFAGEGNIDVDPQFVDPAGGDFRLQSGSACVDAGENAAVPAEVSFDLDGLDRFVDDPLASNTGAGTPPLVDLGAYERQVLPGDADGNGVIDQTDLLVLMETWGDCPKSLDSCLADVNGDGVIDVNDLTALLLLWD